MKKKPKLEKTLESYRFPLWDPKFDFDWIQDETERARHQMMTERRKMRILMRGIKIGKKKGGDKMSSVGFFESKK